MIYLFGACMIFISLITSLYAVWSFNSKHQIKERLAKLEASYSRLKYLVRDLERRSD